MKRSLFGCALTISMAAVLAVPLAADVKTRDKTQFKLEGMLGKMVGMFGGKGAREGVVGATAVKGDRMATRTDNTGQIVDLKEEKIYEVDYSKKEYKVTTFEEMRRRIREQQERAREQAAKAEGRDEKQEQKKPEKEYEIDFDVKETGQRKQIAGYDARQVIMTVIVREKGKALDESGGLVMASDTWFGPEIPALKELANFEMRYFKQLYGEQMLGTSADQMAMVMAMYPLLSKATERLKKEGDKLKGTPLSTTTTLEGVKSKEEMTQPADQGNSGGGLSGMLARKMMKKEDPKQRALIFTLFHETQEIATSVDAAELAIPAGFKEKK